MINIAAQRRIVSEEAKSWMWTPFHWHSQVKGPKGGCDCGSLLKASYDRVGTGVELPRPKGKPYTTQFFLHQVEEVYLKALALYCFVGGHKFEDAGWVKKPCQAHQDRFQLECLDCQRMPSEVWPPECKRCGLAEDLHLLEYPTTPQPGDIVCFFMGKAYGHAGIVIEWPMIVHASARDGYVVQSHAEGHPELNGRDKLYFSLKVWHPERR